MLPKIPSAIPPSNIFRALTPVSSSPVGGDTATKSSQTPQKKQMPFGKPPMNRRCKQLTTEFKARQGARVSDEKLGLKFVEPERTALKVEEEIARLKEVVPLDQKTQTDFDNQLATLKKEYQIALGGQQAHAMSFFRPPGDQNECGKGNRAGLLEK